MCAFASYMGAWIEIFILFNLFYISCFASYMGAWIEIRFLFFKYREYLFSHPIWVRGLKYTPGTGVVKEALRILYGCVD